MKQTSTTLEIAGKTLTFSVGKLAQQATSSVLARMGDTMVLATIVTSKKETTLDYFPLSVEYVERLYAGGRIKGSRWVKRQGRPTDDAVLTGRLIDRSIRPLFPKEYKNDVQVVVTVLSVDGENEPDILAINAVSCALAISKIPWNGPVAAARIGYLQKEESQKKDYVINPGTAEQSVSDLDLIVTQTKEKTLMLEAGALQVPEDVILQGISEAHTVNQQMIACIEKFVKEVGDTKVAVKPDTLLSEYIAKIEKSYKEDIVHLVELRAQNEGSSAEQDMLVDKIYEDDHTQNPEAQADKKTIAKAVEKVFFKIIRANVIKGKRPDGRKLDEIRKISVDVDILPRTHGSALFQRGDTQALSIATLGAPRMEQLIESPEGEESKRYIHHYAFPPYSVGETGKTGFLSRREIGHGALGERALLGVIPSKDVFPYTIQVNSEVLSSNGSTSMASTCGSTLALMAAGVPILKPVAGIAMGMVSDEKTAVILTDILGLEDFSGDMDFKVAGTDSGITAIQLDVKTLGLTIEQIKEIFEKAKVARLSILKTMLAVIAEPRKDVSQYAPKIEMVKIPVEKIGEVIGPGGKMIKNIMATTGAVVDVEDDGSVSITGTTDESVKKAAEWIKGLTREVHAGEEFEGEVKRILPFGAFVEILPGKEGMVHVSHMAKDFVKDPNDIVTIGQTVKVRVLEIDDQGRINLSMLFGADAEGKGSGRNEGGRGGFSRGPRENRGRDMRQPEPSVQSTQSAPVVQSTHPLSMQFRRERQQTTGGWSGRSSQARPTTSPNKYRKSHY